ncbi:PREDICTED: uncharacterized protein LOC102024541 [Chinchilla lanigera]|uniref:uncharacterized protein LOC102024541 n=1 Tax=Chinchilla lanigera TaxID=34839 RepID=UPI00038E9B69|nr:PREDICTED: uncharacterized protein LOC102024541 [Chinchilla lanigera]XP_013377328.1 PREDICTED: uncharacterized protein LOC102024541 [Chinchilla lanigera]
MGCQASWRCPDAKRSSSPIRDPPLALWPAAPGAKRSGRWGGAGRSVGEWERRLSRGPEAARLTLEAGLGPHPRPLAGLCAPSALGRSRPRGPALPSRRRTRALRPLPGLRIALPSQVSGGPVAVQVDLRWPGAIRPRGPTRPATWAATEERLSWGHPRKGRNTPDLKCRGQEFVGKIKTRGDGPLQSELPPPPLSSKKSTLFPSQRLWPLGGGVLSPQDGVAPTELSDSPAPGLDHRAERNSAGCSEPELPRPAPPRLPTLARRASPLPPLPTTAWSDKRSCAKGDLSPFFGSLLEN